MTISNHHHDWTSLPFISPFIWLDWVAIYAVSAHIHPSLSLLSLLTVILSYTASFWLTIGYGQLSYGIQQYQVLDIPPQCSDPSLDYIDYQTDPRRGNFVCLHVVMFVMGTIAIIFGWPTIFRGDKPADAVIIKLGKWALMMLFFIPLWIGLVIGAADHSFPYLLLNQGNCFASFVSGWVGYADLPDVSWIVKVSTWIGLNS